MNKIEVSFPARMEFIKIKSNQIVLVESSDCAHLLAENISLPASVEIEFRPFKFTPIVRYNNCMLDYWLADIQLFDHKLTFEISNNFFNNYKNKNIKGRIDSLSDQQKSMDHYWDKYIGINNLYPDIVNEIKTLMNQ